MLIAIGIILVIIGILFIFGSRRFVIWFGKYKYEHNLNWMPDENVRTSSLTKEEVIELYTEVKGWRHTLWLIWLIGIRVMGLMFLAAGSIILIAQIFDVGN